LQPGTLIQVVVVQKNANVDDKETYMNYFYEVIEVNTNGNDESQQRNEQHLNDTTYISTRHERRVIYQATLNTRYLFDSGSSNGCSYVPLLPSLLHISDKIPHPGLPVLVEQLRGVGPTATTATPANCCIWHVIGTEYDHHVVQAVQAAQAAADILGRRCLVVSGLAAMAYKHNNRTVSTGGIMDKLSGLQVALDLATTHAPSLLLLSDLDQELSRHDDAVRQQDEGRL
jgi:hypothetical protein